MLTVIASPSSKPANSCVFFCVAFSTAICDVDSYNSAGRSTPMKNCGAAFISAKFIGAAVNSAEVCF